VHQSRTKYYGDQSNRCRDGKHFIFFSKWRPFAILNLLCARLDHPQRAFGGLYHCAKFAWNRCSSFDNMQVLIFCELGFKTPFHGPKIIFGGFDCLNEELSHGDLQRHFLARKHVI